MKQIVPLYSTKCQHVEHMPVHMVILRDNAMLANLVYVINAIMLNMLAKGMHVHGGDSCMYNILRMRLCNDMMYSYVKCLSERAFIIP